MTAVPLRQRVRCLIRLVGRNAEGGRRTAVLVVGGRITALHDRDPLIADLLKRDGGVLVGIFPLPGEPVEDQPLPDEESLVEAVSDMLDMVSDLKRMGDEVKKSAAGKLLGSSHPRATLTEDVVKAIRHANGEPLRIGWATLSTITGIPKPTIQDVCTFRTWAHVR